MSSRRLSIALVVAFALLPAACSSDDSSTAGSTTTARSSTTAESSGTTSSTAPAEPPDQTSPGSVNGLTVQGDTLWLASIGDDQVMQIDRSTGSVLARYDTPGAGPDDVAVAPDGSVYVTGFESGVLGRVVDGAYEEITTLAVAINGIDVASDGTVYVATMEADGKLWRLLADGSSPEIVATGLDMVNAFEFDEETGTVLAPAGGLEAGWIARVDPADGSVEPVVEGLPPVLASTWHPDGRFIALSNVTGELLAVDIDTGTFEVIATVADGAPFDNLAYADDGTLYLSSFVAPTVTEVGPDGTVRVIQVGVAVPAGG